MFDRETIIRRPLRDLFERKPTSPYRHALELLEKRELANSIVILQGAAQKTGCAYCREQIEDVVIPAIQRYEVDRAKRLIKGLELVDETLR